MKWKGLGEKTSTSPVFLDELKLKVLIQTACVPSLHRNQIINTREHIHKEAGVEKNGEIKISFLKGEM